MIKFLAFFLIMWFIMFSMTYGIFRMLKADKRQLLKLSLKYSSITTFVTVVVVGTFVVAFS